MCLKRRRSLSNQNNKIKLSNPLQNQKIKFTSSDRLWIVGDLVNRGSDSLSVLRFLKNFPGNLQCVLGNHDLHLLAVAENIRPLKPSDTFSDILRAKDREELLNWLKQYGKI